MNEIEISYGYNTYCFLAECAVCGRHYDEGELWQTVHWYNEDRHLEAWMLYCEHCFNEIEMVHDWHRPMEENPYCDVKTASLPPKYQWTCSKCGEVVYRDCSEGKPPADGCICGTPKEEDE